MSPPLHSHPVLPLLAFLAILCPASARSFEAPLTEGHWEVLAYRNIPANRVSFAAGSMEIAVDGSAGAIILPLRAPGRFSRLRVEATIDGEVNLDGVAQGEKGGDDFRLRVGLVYAGKKTLNFFQRTVAPAWIRRLHSLAPEGAGISRVEFFNTWQDDGLAGNIRDHPASEIWRENFVLDADVDGRVNQALDIPVDADVVAIWISSDGDDTGSSFRVTIESLALEPA